LGSVCRLCDHDNPVNPEILSELDWVSNHRWTQMDADFVSAHSDPHPCVSASIRGSLWAAWVVRVV